MWIRSQNGKRLVKTTNVCVNINSVITFNEEGLVHLGEYTSEERAKEVVGSIQTQLTSMTHTEIQRLASMAGSMRIEHHEVVFQMSEA